MVTTIAKLPATYRGAVRAVINDWDLDIVARNVILLLIGLVVEDADEAVDCMIHVWYSALIRQSDMDILQHRIRPFIGAVCAKAKDRAPSSIVDET